MRLKPQDRETIQKLNLKHPYVWVATWFGLGFLSPAPGTWGSLGALPFGIIILSVGGPIALAIGALILFPIGIWASHHFERDSGVPDHKMIVVDEVVGQWIALLPALVSPLSILLSFVLFRFFDITKPWPVSYFDQSMKGPYGVMLDDVAAGIMAAAILWGIQHAGFMG